MTTLKKRGKGKKITEKQRKAYDKFFIYTPALGQRICDAIANSTRGIRYICHNNPDFPKPETIRKWLSANLYPEFTRNYELAKQEQSDIMADEIIDIVDEMPLQAENKVQGRYEVERARLRVDSRKWVAAKLKPKKYGERILQELSGRDGAPIQTQNLPNVDLSKLNDEQLAQLENILAIAGTAPGGESKTQS